MRFLRVLIIFLFSGPIVLQGQANDSIYALDGIHEADQFLAGKYRCKIEMGRDIFNQPIYIPVWVLKGIDPGPRIGITAAIHGNELNGIPVIANLVSDIDISALRGIIIAIPGLNPLSIQRDQRRFPDQEDLNRGFPGKLKGNRSQQFINQIDSKILSHLDYLFDLHTASFGRENSLYVRANFDLDTTRIMAQAIGADIILKNKGNPSSGPSSSAVKTMRARAEELDVHTITIELGNPQVFQESMIEKGNKGIQNALSHLGLLKKELQNVSESTIICEKSYWIYTSMGGFLHIVVELKEKIKKGQIIAFQNNAYGDRVQSYYAPEDGVVIGKSSNPANISGGRILHLGIIKQ